MGTRLRPSASYGESPVILKFLTAPLPRAGCALLCGDLGGAEALLGGGRGVDAAAQQPVPRSTAIQIVIALLHAHPFQACRERGKLGRFDSAVSRAQRAP